jgi:hypothetical protein
MKTQNYKNHTRIVPWYHGFTLPVLLILVFGAIRNLIYSTADNQYDASLLVLVTIILCSLYIHSRSFALRAQDRAIRSEEGLRYFILTGKRLDQRLTTNQIIALRFASDEEFPSLAQKAADENLGKREIKRSIRNWRPDYRRV